MTTATRITTAEQLLRAGDVGPCELVKGELIMMSPAGRGHGPIVTRAVVLLANYVEAHDLGEVHSGDPGFVLSRNPDTVRAPDVAFVSKQRALAQDTEGFFEGPPDLAVEVLSPSETASRFNEKLEDYLAAGTQAVWAVDPRRKTITVYALGQEPRVRRESDRVSGGTLLPGFELKVSDVFAVRLR